ncbi:cold-regulated protein 27-like [Humulus lupulus]|uniref:cold-regulated protein 27-like n=1 Tax=Humulus lupulus TaxID=3486 RepID=UPI002B4017D9|nr:cold-regulated protein 27-like [Humulus lupulus]
MHGNFQSVQDWDLISDLWSNSSHLNPFDFTSLPTILLPFRTMDSTESMAAEWTDEKHSLYLKSMETSFVNELYDSMELVGEHMEKENSTRTKPSKQTHSNTRSHRGQFKVLRNGNWQKINYVRTEPRGVNTNEIHNALLSNPWIQHFRSSREAQGAESCSVPQGAAVSASRASDSNSKNATSLWGSSSSKQMAFYHSNLCHKDLLGNNTEVSDQNFIDEKSEGEKSKRVNTQELGAYITNDQVVPLRKTL